MNTIETLISEVCTHLILAGVLRQIVDNDEPTEDVFCVSSFSEEKKTREI